MRCLTMDFFTSYCVNVILMIRRVQTFKYLGALTDGLPHVTHHIHRPVKQKLSEVKLPRCRV